jgi:uncharacterized phiE125 gp8 family phage protein
MAWQRHPVLSLISGPNPEPVDTTDAKNYLRIDTSADDDLIDSLIHAARMWVENYTGRALITQTFDQLFRGLPASGAPLVLAKAPVASVTNITYLDENGVSRTLASSNYALRTTAGPMAGRALIEVSSTFTAPSLYSEAEYPVIVRTVCGYGNPSTVPQGMKAAIMLLLGDMYEQRQETILGGSSKSQTTVERLLAPFRLPEAH